VVIALSANAITSLIALLKIKTILSWRRFLDVITDPSIPPNVARFSTTCRPDSIYDRDKRELKNRPVGHVRLGP